MMLKYSTGSKFLYKVGREGIRSCILQLRWRRVVWRERSGETHRCYLSPHPSSKLKNHYPHHHHYLIKLCNTVTGITKVGTSKCINRNVPTHIRERNVCTVQQPSRTCGCAKQGRASPRSWALEPCSHLRLLTPGAKQGRPGRLKARDWRKAFTRPTCVGSGFIHWKSKNLFKNLTWNLPIIQNYLWMLVTHYLDICCCNEYFKLCLPTDFYRNRYPEWTLMMADVYEYSFKRISWNKVGNSRTALTPEYVLAK